MLDLALEQLRQIFYIFDIFVELGQLGVRNGNQFGILTCFVSHLQHANRTAADDRAGNQRVGSRNQHIHRIPVQREGVVDVAVVARVEHGSGHETVNEYGTRLLVDLVLDGIGILRDFDDNIDIFWQLFASGNQVQAHGVSLN